MGLKVGVEMGLEMFFFGFPVSSEMIVPDATFKLFEKL